MTILCYHTVDPDWRSPLAVTPERFAAHCRWLARHRTVVDLPTALRLLDRRGRLPRGTACLTFDDGFTGVREHALPILKRYGLPSAVFVVADTLTPGRGPVDWVDTPPRWELETLTRDDVGELEEAGVHIASHSLSHHTLTELDPEACEQDLRHSRELLEEVLGRAVTELAYPRGRHDHGVRRAAERAGYHHAFALPEAAEPVGALSIPRVGVHGHNTARTVAVKSTTPYLSVRTGGSYHLVRRLRAPGRARRHQTYRTAPQGTAPGRRPSVAYVVSRFPKVSETFVLYELLAVEASGTPVRFFPLLRERTDVMHPEARDLLERATFLPFLSTSIVASQLWFLRHRRHRYLRALADVIRGTWGSTNFLFGALGIFPKVVHAARQMESEGIEHVHCHFANHPAVAGLVIKRLTGIPYSFTAHGSDLHVDRRMLATKVAEASFVVTISESNRAVILAECGPEAADKVHVVHCGVDTAVFERDEVGRDGTLDVVCVGTLHEVKGQAVLLDACRTLLDRGVAVRCLLVGDGPDRRSLERRIAESRLDDVVRITGRQPREVVVEALRGSDVLVAPSVPTRKGKREGLPVVLMEAMSMGLPVVASRLSGIPELVRHDETGLLVPPGDATAIADALERLFHDEVLGVRLGACGRRTVRAEFDLTTNAERLAGLFARSAGIPVVPTGPATEHEGEVAS